MSAQRHNRRRGQGMTEYIILVGIIGLLLIAAVNKFAFAVDEAIQGSANAFTLRGSPEDYVSDPSNPSSSVEKTSLGFSEQGEVFAVPVHNGSGWEFQKQYSDGSAYQESHGSITSGRGF